MTSKQNLKPTNQIKAYLMCNLEKFYLVSKSEASPPHFASISKNTVKFFFLKYLII